MITLLFFGQLPEKTGARKIEIQFSGGLGELEAKLEKDFPGFQAKGLLISVNQNLVRDKVAIQDGDEVAFMPPFAGG